MRDLLLNSVAPVKPSSPPPPLPYPPPPPQLNNHEYLYIAVAAVDGRAVPAHMQQSHAVGCVTRLSPLFDGSSCIGDLEPILVNYLKIVNIYIYMDQKYACVISI